VSESAKPFIPVYKPWLTAVERDYVMECLDSTWISSKGAFIERFEREFAGYVGARHAVAVCNGTVAVHLTLLGLGIGPGDEVIVPTLTFIASVNPILYCGATPVFVDCDPVTWQIDPADVARKLSPRTKAIMAVHLYGLPADMAALRTLADQSGVSLIEDCAEAIGSRIDGRHVGVFSDIAAFSLFGNKTITTGEGGMVVTNRDDLHQLLVRLKGQGLVAAGGYWHDIVGYNYRMTNLCAAIGCAQMTRIEEIVDRKIGLADRYRQRLAHVTGVALHDRHDDRYVHSHWMITVLVRKGTRDAIMAFMREQGIETRPVFPPVHQMPMYQQCDAACPVADDLSARGISLPSWPLLSDAEVDRVVAALAEGVARAGA
jgi:perosamine synthetase